MKRGNERLQVETHNSHRLPCKRQSLVGDINVQQHMSHLMGKPTICIGENKDADQLRGTAKLISAFVFATRIGRFLYFLNPKFPVSSCLLCLYSLACVGPVRKPHCWFFHEAAHIFEHWSTIKIYQKNNLIVMVYKNNI